MFDYNKNILKYFIIIKMIELFTLKSSTDNGRKWDDLTEEEQKRAMVINSIVVLIYIIIFVWALMRASKQKNKPLHLMFALISPAFYLVFSYFVDGFNN